MLSPFGGALRPGDGRQKRTGEMKTHQGARFEILVDCTLETASAI